jgi:cytidylate kinase
MNCNVIAIDGPSASGKSTVARGVAKAQGWLYVDSGALYRAVAWKALQDGIDVSEEDSVNELVSELEPDFYVEDGSVRFRVDGIALNRELREEVINRSVSPVAANQTVRKRVTQWLREMLAHGNLVMEGRDIGTAVFPDASYKFYLDASPDERARRRHAEMEDMKAGMSVGDVHASLSRRDSIDSRRMTAPLAIAEDAVVVDSTGMSIEDAVQFVIDRIRQGS